MGQLFTLQGKEHVPLTEIGPGDIGAVAKLKEVGTGDVLTTGPTEIAFDPITFPPALMSFSVTAHDASDEDRCTPRCAACATRIRRWTCTTTSRPAT